MAERVAPGPVNSEAVIREAVSISTRKIFDSCRDKDCIEDLRIYPTLTSQSYIDKALSVRPRRAELLYCSVNVEPISFNRGYFTVDCTYFYRLTGETFPAGESIQGLAVFDKRVMLFGSEGSAKVFSSQDPAPALAEDDLPTAIVSTVDPIALRMKLVEADCPGDGELEQRSIPEFVAAAFPEALLLADTGRRWYGSIGQFSIVRLERDTQVLIPAYEYSLPEKECPGSDQDDPCELFSKIRFPVEEFFPPNVMESDPDYRSML